MAKANFELKNDSFQLMRVKVGAADWAGLQEYLADQIEQAPELLGSCLIALDVSSLAVPNAESMDDLLLRLRYAGALSCAFVAEPGSAWALLLAERSLPMLLPPIKLRGNPKVVDESLINVHPAFPPTFELVPPESNDKALQASRKKRTAGADFETVLGQVFAAKTQAQSEPSQSEAKSKVSASNQAGAAIVVKVSLDVEKAAPVEPIAAITPALTAQRYEGQVRSGQQMYAKGRDLVITGNVGAGAEVVSDNSVHIYGKLMGKAVAGASGDRNARIYCLAFGAELVSIAGIFRVFESVPSDIRGKPVHIFLDGDKIKIEPFV